jgi:hypothetical protein
VRKTEIYTIREGKKKGKDPLGISTRTINEGTDINTIVIRLEILSYLPQFLFLHLNYSFRPIYILELSNGDDP